jgi:hypothetical protein
MKATEIVDEIRKVLGIELSKKEVTLAVMKLENGTEIEAEEFAKDQEVFITGEEGEKIALPVGNYTLEDGKILSVIEEGLIDAIAEAQEEVEEVEEEVEAEAAPEAKVKSMTESTQVVYATKEELDSLSTKIEELKTLLEKNNTVEEEVVTEEVADLELSAEVVEPIAHNPEAQTVQINNHRESNTQMSRIRELIYQNQ